MHLSASFSTRPENRSVELVSPRITSENHGTVAQGVHPFQSNRPVSGSIKIPEVGVQKFDGSDNKTALDPSQGGDNFVRVITKAYS